MANNHNFRSRVLHVRNIRPMKVKAKIPYVHVQLSKTLEMSPGFKSNPFPFIDTKSIKKTIGFANLLGTSKSLFQFDPLYVHEIVLVAMNPTMVLPKYNNLVEIDEEGVLRPSDIPDLSDLALLPKALKYYFEWLIEKSNQNNIHLHLRQVQSLCSTTLPLQQEEFFMTGGQQHDISIASFSNVMKTVTFNTNMVRCVTIFMETVANTDDWRDGRTTKVSLQLNDALEPPRGGKSRRQSNDSVMKMIIWNCRGMAKNRFKVVYDYVVKNHWPEIVILTESRVPAIVGKSILKNTNVKMLEPIGITGGAAVISVNNDVGLQMITYGSACEVEIGL